MSAETTDTEGTGRLERVETGTLSAVTKTPAVVALLVALSYLVAGCSSESSPSGAAGGAGIGGQAAGGAAGSGGSAGSLEPFHLTVAVTTHPSQPMVVDLELSGLQGSLRVAVPGDPGVRVAEPVPAGAGQARVRLRGLPPGADVSVELGDEAGSFEYELHTLAPLPGFVANFPVTIHGTSADDYRMFDRSEAIPYSNATLFVIDSTGETRFFLPFPNDGDVAKLPIGIKLLANGNLLFLNREKIRVVDELGQTQLSIGHEQLGAQLFHHDVIVLPGGHFLTLSIATREIYYPDEDATHYVAGDFLTEFDSSGTVYWTWNSFDHLDPLRKRNGFDLTFYAINHPVTGEAVKDWTHTNGVIYSPDDNSLILSVRHQDWLVKIDRASGDIVWRLGEGGDFALPTGQRWFYHPHSPELQPGGTLLLYDNGNGNPNLPAAQHRSRAIELELNPTSGEANIIWEDTVETYLSPIAGDADRLSNGNVLVLDSVMSVDSSSLFPARVRLKEIDPETGAWVWTLLTDPGFFSYRAVPTSRLPGEVSE